ncbi:MAG: alginate export family protein [Planctomycetes bacterium]|nr:alginate export family protein [Planctomycetota bacterium]
MIGIFDAVEAGGKEGRAKGCDCDSCPGGKGDSKGGCSAVRKAASSSHKGVFYANDFSYLCNSGCCDTYFGDSLKRLAVGNCWTVDVGGQYRMRFHNEQNINNSGIPNNLGLTGDDDNFLLHRTRLYVNAEYGSHFRFYGEMLDALSELGSGPPRPIEENRTELQNLFIEFKGVDVGRGVVGARIGRQEIVLGAQRMVSPLDWANTRRTFEGARVMWKGDNWDVDGIWLRPMKRDFSGLDAPNLDRQLYGMYGTYKNLCRDHLEAYWLALDYEDVGVNGIRYDTVGARYWGNDGDWLYELEASAQFGANSDNTDHSAGAVTAGLGRKFPCTVFSPTLWAYYDWASGDDTVGNGYHHYEPLAHKYLGFMDLFGRRNIQDMNLQLTANLTDKVKFLCWYHYFRLADGDDVPYNVTMSNFNGQAAGTSGSKDLGHELDFAITHNITPRVSVLYGYSHFFAGDYYTTTAGVPHSGDADFAYLQWHVNF